MPKTFTASPKPADPVYDGTMNGFGRFGDLNFWNGLNVLNDLS